MPSGKSQDLVVWIDGRFVPSSSASISVFDHSFNYGDAVFEGIKFLDGRIFDLSEHIARLYQSANHLRIMIPADPPTFAAHVIEAIRANGLRDGYLRIVVSRGSGPLGLRNMDKITKPTVVIICQRETPKSVKELVEAPGKRAKTASTRRTPAVCLDPRIKSCNYLNNIVADLERRASGADFALMLDVEGYLCEGPAENVFLAKGDRLLTPLASKCLNGITRRTIIAIASELSLRVAEADLTLYDAYDADEMFSTGSLNDITWISELDGRPIGKGNSAGNIVRMLLPAVRERGYTNGVSIY